MESENFMQKKYRKIFNKFYNFDFSKLFENNKFVIGFSIFISFIVWTVVAINDIDNRVVTVSDIPIDIQLSDSAVQDGLKIFSGQDAKARVDIRGNRFVISQVTKNDIQVTANQAGSTIISPGNYTLELSAKKLNNTAGYEIVSEVRPTFITVMVDRFREVEINIESDINFNANPDFFVGNIVTSASSVKVAGPESEISKIKKAVAKGEISGEIDQTTTAKCQISLYDDYNRLISNERITTSLSEIDVTVPVLMKKEIPIFVEFDNAPKDFVFPDNMIEISPKTLEVVGPKDVMNDFEKIVLSPIDIRKVDIKSTEFELPIMQMPSGCKSLKDIYSAKVTLNLSDFRERNLRVNQFTFLNVPEGKVPKVFNGFVDITIIGPSNRINSIKESDVVAVIDLQNKADGYMEISTDFIVNNKYIWTVGEYFVNVGIS